MKCFLLVAPRKQAWERKQGQGRMPEPERMRERGQGELGHKERGQKPGEGHGEVRQQGRLRPRKKVLIPEQKRWKMSSLFETCNKRQLLF